MSNVPITLRNFFYFIESFFFQQLTIVYAWLSANTKQKLIVIITLPVFINKKTI